jgi:hypothetical protein
MGTIEGGRFGPIDPGTIMTTPAVTTRARAYNIPIHTTKQYKSKYLFFKINL